MVFFFHLSLCFALFLSLPATDSIPCFVSYLLSSTMSVCLFTEQYEESAGCEGEVRAVFELNGYKSLCLCAKHKKTHYDELIKDAFQVFLDYGEKKQTVMVDPAMDCNDFLEMAHELSGKLLIREPQEKHKCSLHFHTKCKLCV